MRKAASTISLAMAFSVMRLSLVSRQDAKTPRKASRESRLPLPLPTRSVRRASGFVLTAKWGVWLMLRAAAEEAVANVAIKKEKAVAETEPCASRAGAVQSSSSEQPHLQERPTIL